MNNPVISLLVPVYNVQENYLRTCIESLQNQTFRDIEIVLVDDGSTDMSGTICDEYGQKDERIRVIHKKNGGLSAARNSAFDASRGTYIMFIDSDDYLDPSACLVALNAIVTQNVQMVFWNQVTENKRSSIPQYSLGKKTQSFDKDGCEWLQERVLNFNGKISQVFCKLIRKDFLIKEQVRHIEKLKQGAEGIVFTFQLFGILDSAYYFPDILYHYRYNEQSISHKPDERTYRLIIQCFRYIDTSIQNLPDSRRAELRKLLCDRMLYVVVTTAISGYFNPDNPEPYHEQVEGFNNFITQPFVQESIMGADTRNLDLQRRAVLWFLKRRWFLPIRLLAGVRKIQYNNK